MAGTEQWLRTQAQAQPVWVLACCLLAVTTWPADLLLRAPLSLSLKRASISKSRNKDKMSCCIQST